MTLKERFNNISRSKTVFLGQLVQRTSWNLIDGKSPIVMLHAYYLQYAKTVKHHNNIDIITNMNH